MRVQPLLPTSPFEASTTRRRGSAQWACSAASRPAPPEPRTSTSQRSVSTTALPSRQLPGRVLLLAEAAEQRHRQPLVGGADRLVDLGRVLGEEAAAGGVALDQQRPEVL